MISSGLSLIRALTILVEQTENTKLAEVIDEIRNQVESGRSLSEALAEHDDVFPKLYIAMVRAGETAGMLDAGAACASPRRSRRTSRCGGRSSRR